MFHLFLEKRLVGFLKKTTIAERDARLIEKCIGVKLTAEQIATYAEQGADLKRCETLDRSVYEQVEYDLHKTMDAMVRNKMDGYDKVLVKPAVELEVEQYLARKGIHIELPEIECNRTSKAEIGMVILMANKSEPESKGPTGMD